MSSTPDAVPAFRNVIKIDGTSGMWNLAHEGAQVNWKVPVDFTTSDGKEALLARLQIGGFQTTLTPNFRNKCSGTGTTVSFDWECATTAGLRLKANPYNKDIGEDIYPIMCSVYQTDLYFQFDAAALKEGKWTEGKWKLEIGIHPAGESSDARFSLLLDDGKAGGTLGPGDVTIDDIISKVVALGINDLKGRCTIAYTLTQYADA